MSNLRLRKCKIVQFLENPKTKEKYITSERVDMICKSWKIVKKYAWVIHDKDVYTKDSQEVIDKKKKVGDIKPTHIHIVLDFGKNAYPIERIARKFGIKENFIEQIFGGKHSFIECVEYLTHESKIEQANGKTLYTDDKIISNFDFRTEIEKMKYQKEKYGDEEINIDILENKIFNGILTMDDVREDYNEFASKYYERLQKARIHYIETLPTPLTHINYFFGGKGGRLGKTNGAIGFCYDLLYRYYNINVFAPNFRLTDYVYLAEGRGVGMDNYDGQKIIIWDDYRPEAILDTFKDYGTFLKGIDTNAGSVKTVHIKILYGKMKLVNAINMFVCPMSYEEFKRQFIEKTKEKKHNEKLDKDFIWLEPEEQFDGRFYFNNIFEMDKIRISINNDLIKYNLISDKDKRFEMIPFATIPNYFHLIYDKTQTFDCNYAKGSIKLLEGVDDKLGKNIKALTDKTLQKEKNVNNPELDNYFDELIKKGYDEIKCYELLLKNWDNHIICGNEIHTKDTNEYICSLDYYNRNCENLRNEWFENKKIKSIHKNDDELPF